MISTPGCIGHGHCEIAGGFAEHVGQEDDTVAIIHFFHPAGDFRALAFEFRI